MIKQLHISNYALIDRLDIEFADGLTIITGETGAGKSIILGALSLILGERADLKAIRDADSKTIVEATFDIAGYGLEPFFKEYDIDWDEHECIVRRELSPSGRSRAFVNDTPVALAALRELVTRLLDIHSQHNNMLLSNPQFQLSILDSIAGNADLLGNYHKAYAEYREAEQRLAETVTAMERLKQNEDYIRFQLDQLQAMQLQPDEDQQLEALQARLSNITSLKEALWSVENELDGEENGVLAHLTSVVQRLDEAERCLTEISGMSDRVRSSLIDLKDIAQDVGNIMDTLNDDPSELARVDERLSSIYSLMRKHNAQNVNQLIDIQHDYERQLGEIDHNDEMLEQLKSQVEETFKASTAIAADLSANRRQAATKFVKELRQRCYDAMNDDLMTQLVISYLFEACHVVNALIDRKATICADCLKELSEVMHLFTEELLGLKNEKGSNNDAREESFGKVVDMVLDLRAKAKAAKDWATSDLIRDELASLGFEVKDTKEGATWKLNK